MSASPNLHSSTADGADFLFGESDSAALGERDFGNLFDGVLAAHRQEGFEAGYRRATNDLLAEFVLVCEELIYEKTSGPIDLRQVLQSLGKRLELTAGAVAKDHYVDGGLGI